MLWQLFLIFLLISVFIIRWRNRGKRQLAKILKSDLPTLPFLGISHHFIGSDEDRMVFLDKLGKEAIKQGGLTHMWLGHRFFCVCSDPVEAEFVLKNCMEKDDVLKFARAITGNGSIFAPAVKQFAVFRIEGKGSQCNYWAWTAFHFRPQDDNAPAISILIWRRRRKVLAPTFGLKNLNQFVSIFSKQSSIMVNKLAEAADKGTFSIWRYMTSYTMDSIFQTTMGTQLRVQEQPDHPFFKNFERCAELVSMRTLQPWLHSDLIYRFTAYHKDYVTTKDFITNFVSKTVKQKSQAIFEKLQGTINSKSNKEPENPRTNTFLESLIESSGGDKGYTTLELQEESMVLLLAGIDTSAVGASFVAVMLSKHPEIQDKLFEEIQEVLGDSDRPITPEDLPRLKYLDAVVRETLRLYPPVPITARMTEKDIILPSGIKLVANVGIVIHIRAIHRNPKYWGPDAEVFRPERFFDSPPEHPAAYMPFSFGPRNCLGYQYATMSMKTVIANLMRRYQVLPSEQTISEGSKPLRVKYSIMMKHVDNFKLKLVSRK